MTQAETIEDGRLSGQLPVTQKAVNHDVPDQENFLGRDAFVFQIVDAALLGDEKQAGNRIGQLAIDFLWHSHVEAAQSGLDVRHFNAQLHRFDPGYEGRSDRAHSGQENAELAVRRRYSDGILNCQALTPVRADAVIF